MTDEAKRLFIELHDELAARAELSDNRLASAMSKLRAYCARIALVLHLADEAGLGMTLDDPSPIDEKTMRSACELTRWFANESERIYGSLIDKGAEPENDRARLLQMIRNKGGSVSPRDVQLWRRSKYPTAERARKALESLERDGQGGWRASAFGPGRPSEKFFLTTNRSEDSHTPH